jgi:hypothetical protein
MVAAHELLVADRTDEVLLASVRSRVPGELVGPGETLPAARPRAGERSLAWCRTTTKCG